MDMIALVYSLNFMCDWTGLERVGGWSGCFSEVFWLGLGVYLSAVGKEKCRRRGTMAG